MEFATMATCSSGVMARLVGGPNTEFIRGKLATMRGASRVVMSTMVTRSFPGGKSWILPASSHVTFSSMPTIMYCGPDAADFAGVVVEVAAQADAASPARSASPRAHQPLARTLFTVLIGAQC